MTLSFSNVFFLTPRCDLKEILAIKLQRMAWYGLEKDFNVKVWEISLLFTGISSRRMVRGNISRLCVNVFRKCKFLFIATNKYV